MRLAIRSLLKDPGFAILAAGSLAVGIGLAAALSGIADAILFRPLPVPDPGKIVRVFTSSEQEPFGLSSFPDFEDLRRAVRSVSMTAQTQVMIACSVDRSSAAEVRLGLAVPQDYFDVLGVQPAAGRFFRSEESHGAVVVLAHGFFESRFGGDPRAIGRTILLSATAFTIVGVAPADFALDRFVHEDFYVPIQAWDAGLLPANGHPNQDRGRRYLRIYARLRRGWSVALARAEIATVFARLESEHPESNRGRRGMVTTEFDARVEADHTMPRLAMLLMAVTALITAVACANVAGLMLLRAETRAAETAVKLALGATRARLLREHLAVASVIAIVGAAAAAPVAKLVALALSRAITVPSDISFAITPRTDLRILLAAALLVTLACGFAPAFARRRGTRARDVLVVGEIAFASGLAACGMMLGSAISSAARIDPGFRTEHVLTMALDPAQVRYEEARGRAFYDQVLDRLGHLERVKAVALAQSAPLGFTGAQRQIEIAGEPERSAIWINIVTPGYFDLLRIPIVAGRGFEASDSATSPPVAIVNEALARRCGVGSRFRMHGRIVQVIGVARNAQYLIAGEAPRPSFYLPFSQNYSSRMMLHAETESSPEAMVKEIRTIDPLQPVSEIRAAGDYLREGATFRARLALATIASVGACGLLALGGLYSVVARSVAARRREIGVRMALGATAGSVAMGVVMRAARLAGMGTVLGSAAAFGVRNALAGLVSGVGLPRFAGIAPVIVFALSLCAAFFPARRAMRVDPARLLHT
jgi:predicted permease